MINNLIIQPAKKRSYGEIIFWMCLLYLTSFIFESKFIEILLSALIILVFFISLLKANKMLSIFCVSMFIAGVFNILLTEKGGQMTF